jgi:hypothetical protein
MTNDEIDPLVPEMPEQTSTAGVAADGGLQQRYDASEVEAPLVPEF